MRLYLLQVLYCLPHSLGGSFTILFFLRLGFSTAQIAVFYVVHYSVILLAIMLLRASNPYTLIRISLLLAGAGFLAISGLKGAPFFYMIAILLGFMSPLFWVPFNTLYFRCSGRDSRAQLSGFSFIVFPLLNTIVPLLAGAAVDQLGFRVLYAASAFLALAALAYAHHIRERGRMDFGVGKKVEKAKGIRTLVYLEGLWQGIAWTCIPLVTLGYIQTGTDYGSFLSYLGLAGAAAVLLLCRVSDRLGNRTAFITPFITLAAFSTIAACFAFDFGLWVAVNGLISFFIAMTSPFTISLVLDKVADVGGAMVARELFLNAGRLTGAFVLALSLFYTGNLRLPLAIAGLALVLYPLILYRKRLYPHRLSLRGILSWESQELREA
jgi:hypothetical protein